MPAARRLLAALLLAAVLLGAAGCGDGESTFAEGVRDRAEELRDRAERRVDELRERVRQRLEELEQAIPEAGPQTREPRRGDAPIEAFLTEVLTDVDRYWTETLTASDLPEPRVGYVWVEPGRRVRTGCNAIADENAALYCPADDTIYIAQEFARGVLEGVRADFPGTRAGQGRAIGDFGVAYIVAHEYAHNVQQELGYYSTGRVVQAKPFELQADCMAGAWGNSVYRQGKLDPGDVEEALSTAQAVGDFEVRDQQHHGTPDERRAAWLRGYESGDPSTCTAYLPS
jgi:uncharacterized protein